MRIVIDMQGAQTESRYRGIGRYATSFTQAIVRNCGQHEVILALNGLFPETIEPIRAAFDKLLPQENIRVWYAPGPIADFNPNNCNRREAAELIREAFLLSLKPDLIHITSLFEGFVDDAVTSIGKLDRHTPVSVSLYDLIPLLNPEQYLESNILYKQFYIRKIEDLKRASILGAISEFSRNEAIENLPDIQAPIINFSTAIETNFKPLHKDPYATKDLYRKYNLRDSFILYSGGADERKNLQRLIRAYAALPIHLRAKHQLVLAGKMPDQTIKQLKQVAISSGLKTEELCFTGYVTDEELVLLYNFCNLFVFPSWHEGFGLPALEAMACNAAVVGANTSSLPEVIGFNEALFDPLNIDAIRLKMIQALQDKAFRKSLIDNGINQAKRFSWDNSAKRAFEVFGDVTSKKDAEAPLPKLGKYKPKLAFVSPMPPEKTGIAYYSAQLIPSLSEYYDIELIVKQEYVDTAWANEHPEKIHDVNWFRANAGDFDRVIYQVGNSPFHAYMLPLLREIPGIVVLHDFYLSGLMSWLEEQEDADNVWTESLFISHGYNALSERFSDNGVAIQKYPGNLNVLQQAQGLIVHSNYSRKLMQFWYGAAFSNKVDTIPLLRTAGNSIDKTLARKQLGIGANDFIVCSFGFLDFTKLNHRLLECWLKSKLVNDKQCHLFFVGENHSGDYGANLLRTISLSGFKGQIHITGFVPPDIFEMYLMASDIAVQLRTHSRGETSAAVLDCMNHALPLIVNANGSQSELDNDAVWMLPDIFDDAMLIDALENLWLDPEKRQTLGENSQKIIHDHHLPVECAKNYVDSIERFTSLAVNLRPSLIKAITRRFKNGLKDSELIQLAEKISVTIPIQQPVKRLFLDITATCSNGLRTGIERVARALIIGLLEKAPQSLRVEPVYLTESDGDWYYRSAHNFTLDLLNCSSVKLNESIVTPLAGDTILILDISGNTLVKAYQSGLYSKFRNFGVEIYSVVFDLLPITMPEVFPPGSSHNHAEWLKVISKFDGALCISESVSKDLRAWQEKSMIDFTKRRPFKNQWFHLGADVTNSAPTKGFPKNSESIFNNLNNRISFLMVGTIEPRKGYKQALEAFSKLWEDDLEINLIIVGREGWKNLPKNMRTEISSIVARLQCHPESNKRLFWLENISDECLEKVYEASTCLLATSFGEGFGLPLIEASQYHLPIIARDIPVFREVAGDYAFYFDGLESEVLSTAITEWLKLYNLNIHPNSENMPKYTWGESSEELLKILSQKNNY